MKNIAKIVEEKLSGIIDEMGYNLYEVEFVKKQNGMNLTLFIQNKNGQVTLQDCEKVHRAVDPILDEINPTNDEPYYLNVSSIGLDKPLTSSKDFERCLNEMIEIKFFVPQENNKKILIARLKSYDSNNLYVEENGNEKTIPLKDIAVCKLHIEF